MAEDMILYEIKAEKRNICFVLAEAVILFMAGIIAWGFPMVAVKIVEAVNKSDLVMALFGIEEKIEQFTYENIMFTLFLMISPIVLFRNITGIARSIEREKQLGTDIWFFSQGVSRLKLLFSKLFVRIVEFIIEIALLGIIIWRFSLIGVNHDLLNSMITERVFRAVLIMGLAGIFAIAAGFAYGCISSERWERSFALNLLAAGYFVAIIPNIFQGVIAVLKLDNVSYDWFDRIIGFFSEVRRYDILYWSNPFMSANGVGVLYILLYVSAAIVMLAVGGLVYNRKDI